MGADLPVFFVAHGNPMNALGGTALARFLIEWGRGWPTARALLVVSAHWRAPRARLTAATAPPTIHDFYGFPDELYELRYPAPGDPELAALAASLLRDAGLPAELDERRGLDHGAWSPLLQLRPAADLPVVQLSLLGASPQAHRELGAALRPLRRDGVLIVASGNLVHNLGTAAFDDAGAPVADWALAFDEWVAERLLANDHDALCDYAERAPQARQAHPTDEHYLPLLAAAGAAGPDARVSFPHAGFEHGTISQRCVRFDSSS